MSGQAIHDILDRSLLDEQFRRAVQTDPDTALAEFELTDEERAALATRNYAEIATAEQGKLPGQGGTRAPIRLAPTVGPVNQVTVQATVEVVQVSSFNVVQNLSVTPIVFLNTANVVAMGYLDESRRTELEDRGATIVQMAGDRTQPIKELLALMR